MDVSQDYNFLPPRQKLLSQIKQAKDTGCADSRGKNFPSILAAFQQETAGHFATGIENGTGYMLPKSSWVPIKSFMA